MATTPGSVSSRIMMFEQNSPNSSSSSPPRVVRNYKRPPSPGGMVLSSPRGPPSPGGNIVSGGPNQPPSPGAGRMSPNNRRPPSPGGGMMMSPSSTKSRPKPGDHSAASSLRKRPPSPGGRTGDDYRNNSRSVSPMRSPSPEMMREENDERDQKPTQGRFVFSKNPTGDVTGTIQVGSSPSENTNVSGNDSAHAGPSPSQYASPMASPMQKGKIPSESTNINGNFTSPTNNSISSPSENTYASEKFRSPKATPKHQASPSEYTNTSVENSSPSREINGRKNDNPLRNNPLFLKKMQEVVDMDSDEEEFDMDINESPINPAPSPKTKLTSLDRNPLYLKRIAQVAEAAEREALNDAEDDDDLQESYDDSEESYDDLQETDYESGDDLQERNDEPENLMNKADAVTEEWHNINENAFTEPNSPYHQSERSSHTQTSEVHHLSDFEESPHSKEYKTQASPVKEMGNVPKANSLQHTQQFKPVQTKTPVPAEKYEDDSSNDTLSTDDVVGTAATRKEMLARLRGADEPKQQTNIPGIATKSVLSRTLEKNAPESLPKVQESNHDEPVNDSHAPYHNSSNNAVSSGARSAFSTSSRKAALERIRSSYKTPGTPGEPVSSRQNVIEHIRNSRRKALNLAETKSTQLPVIHKPAARKAIGPVLSLDRRIQQGRKNQPMEEDDLTSTPSDEQSVASNNTSTSNTSRGQTLARIRDKVNRARVSSMSPMRKGSLSSSASSTPKKSEHMNVKKGLNLIKKNYGADNRVTGSRFTLSKQSPSRLEKEKDEEEAPPANSSTRLSASLARLEQLKQQTKERGVRAKAIEQKRQEDPSVDSSTISPSSSDQSGQSSVYSSSSSDESSANSSANNQASSSDESSANSSANNQAFNSVQRQSSWAEIMEQRLKKIDSNAESPKSYSFDDKDADTWDIDKGVMDLSSPESEQGEDQSPTSSQMFDRKRASKENQSPRRRRNRQSQSPRKSNKDYFSDGFESDTSPEKSESSRFLQRGVKHVKSPMGNSLMSPETNGEYSFSDGFYSDTSPEKSEEHYKRRSRNSKSPRKNTGKSPEKKEDNSFSDELNSETSPEKIYTNHEVSRETSPERKRSDVFRTKNDEDDKRGSEEQSLPSADFQHQVNEIMNDRIHREQEQTPHQPEVTPKEITGPYQYLLPRVNGQPLLHVNPPTVSKNAIVFAEPSIRQSFPAPLPPIGPPSVNTPASFSIQQNRSFNASEFHPPSSPYAIPSSSASHHQGFGYGESGQAQTAFPFPQNVHGQNMTATPHVNVPNTHMSLSNSSGGETNTLPSQYFDIGGNVNSMPQHMQEQQHQQLPHQQLAQQHQQMSQQHQQFAQQQAQIQQPMHANMIQEHDVPLQSSGNDPTHLKKQLNQPEEAVTELSSQQSEKDIMFDQFEEDPSATGGESDVLSHLPEKFADMTVQDERSLAETNQEMSTLIGLNVGSDDEDDLLDKSTASQSLAEWWENTYAKSQDKDTNSFVQEALTNMTESQSNLDGFDSADSDEDIFDGLDESPQILREKKIIKSKLEKEQSSVTRKGKASFQEKTKVLPVDNELDTIMSEGSSDSDVHTYESPEPLEEDVQSSASEVAGPVIEEKAPVKKTKKQQRLKKQNNSNANEVNSDNSVTEEKVVDPSSVKKIAKSPGGKRKKNRELKQNEEIRGNMKQGQNPESKDMVKKTKTKRNKEISAVRDSDTSESIHQKKERDRNAVNNTKKLAPSPKSRMARKGKMDQPQSKRERTHPKKRLEAEPANEEASVVSRRSIFDTFACGMLDPVVEANKDVRSKHRRREDLDEASVDNTLLGEETVDNTVGDEETVDNTVGDGSLTVFTRDTRDQTVDESVSSRSESDTDESFSSDASDTLDSKISANIPLSAKERSVWDDWDRKDNDYSVSRVSTESETDCSATVSSQKKQQHLEHRARSHEKLLMHAYAALSIPPPQRGSEKGEENMPNAMNYGGNDGHSQEVSFHRTLSSDAENAGPSNRMNHSTHSDGMVSQKSIGIQKQTLQKFCLRIKNEGIEVLKLNRENKWQTRFLTVSKEGAWLKKNNDNMAPSFCPLGILWVKKFNKSKEHSVTLIDKQGKGGMLLAKMSQVKEANDFLKHPLTKKQQERYANSVIVRIQGDKTEKDKATRYTTLRCTKADAVAILVGCNAIVDVLRGEGNSVMKSSAPNASVNMHRVQGGSVSGMSNNGYSTSSANYGGGMKTSSSSQYGRGSQSRVMMKQQSGPARPDTQYSRPMMAKMRARPATNQGFSRDAYQLQKMTGPVPNQANGSMVVNSHYHNNGAAPTLSTSGSDLWEA